MHRRFDPPRFVYEHHAGWYWAHVVVTFAFLAVLAALTYWLVTSARRHAVAGPMRPPMPPATDPALTEARMRYARGELSRDDYLRIAADLGGALPPPGSE